MRTRRRVRPITIEQLLESVRREFAALPGLSLTEAQVCRVWGLDTGLTHRVLRRLVDGQFLTKTPAGQYVRADARAPEPSEVGSD